MKPKKKIYPLPRFDTDVVQAVVHQGYCFSRKSKDTIKVQKFHEEYDMSPGRQYERYYSFHINFETKKVDGMNINEYTSAYKRATIWVKPEELQMLIAVEANLNRLLEAGKIEPNMIEV